MRGINSIHIVGHLGQDAEMRHTASGKPVVNINVATKGYNDETSWHRVVCWGKHAEFAQLLKKGDLVYVEGRMDYRSYNDPQTQEKRDSAEIIANRIQGLGKKDRGSESHTQPPAASGAAGEGFDEGLPF